MEYLDRLKGWIQQPFTTGMDLTSWVLFTILVVTVAVLWVKVLKHIQE